jgi:hypothetical protein
MKSIVSILTESPFYFTLPLRERHDLVMRLRDKEQSIDLSDYQILIAAFLEVDKTNLPSAWWPR